MTSGDHTHPPLDLHVLSGSDDGHGAGRWRVEVLEESGSTNAEVADRFRAGAEQGLVVVAEHQTAGRGRLGREWVTPPRTSLTVSVLLTPDVPAERWPWLPLATGLAAARAVHSVTGIEVGLKWPNDVMVGADKLAGILLERVDVPGRGAAAVLGIGINVGQTREELPIPTATSLALVAGAPVDRTALLLALLEELAAVTDRWTAGDDLRTDYLDLCLTVGQVVRVSTPSGDLTGQAIDIDRDGQLVVRTEAGEEPHLGAGDVVHVRPATD